METSRRPGMPLTQIHPPFPDQWTPIPKGLPYRRTQFNGATLVFSYVGTDVYLCLTADAATYDFTMDGQLVKTATQPADTDPACASSGAKTMFYTSGAAQGHHEVEIPVLASPSQEFQFFGAVIASSVTSDSSTIVEKPIDDQDPLWDISPERGTDGWQFSNDSSSNGLLGNGHIWTCIYNSKSPRSASYTFTGVGGVIMRGTIGTNLQVYSVDFDGETTALDATSVWPDPRSGVLFFRGGLNPMKQYTITLRNFNSNFPQSNSLYYLPSNQHLTGFCASLDGIVLLAGDSAEVSTGTAAPDGPSGAPASPPRETASARSAKKRTASIVGAVLGGLAAVAIVLGAAFAMVRRRGRARRHANHASPLMPMREPSQAETPQQSRSEKLRMLTSTLAASGSKRRRAAYRDANETRRSESGSALGSSDATASTRRRLDGMPPEVLGRLLNLVEIRMDGGSDVSASARDAVSETTTSPPRYRW